MKNINVNIYFKDINRTQALADGYETIQDAERAVVAWLKENHPGIVFRQQESAVVTSTVMVIRFFISKLVKLIL